MSAEDGVPSASCASCGFQLTAPGRALESWDADGLVKVDTVCSKRCKAAFLKTRSCQVCRRHDTSLEILAADGHAYCDATNGGEGPSCAQRMRLHRQLQKYNIDMERNWCHHCGEGIITRSGKLCDACIAVRDDRSLRNADRSIYEPWRFALENGGYDSGSD